MQVTNYFLNSDNVGGSSTDVRGAVNLSNQLVLRDWSRINLSNFESSVSDLLAAELPKVKFDQYRVLITFDYEGVYKCYSVSSVDLDVSLISHLLYNVAISYHDNYHSEVALNTVDINYMVEIRRGLILNMGHKELPDKNSGRDELKLIPSISELLKTYNPG